MKTAQLSSAFLASALTLVSARAQEGDYGSYPAPTPSSTCTVTTTTVVGNPYDSLTHYPSTVTETSYIRCSGECAYATATSVYTGPYRPVPDIIVYAPTPTTVYMHSCLTTGDGIPQPSVPVTTSSTLATEYKREAEAPLTIQSTLGTVGTQDKREAEAPYTIHSTLGTVGTEYKREAEAPFTRVSTVGCTSTGPVVNPHIQGPTLTSYQSTATDTAFVDCGGCTAYQSGPRLQILKKRIFVSISSTVTEPITTTTITSCQPSATTV